MQRTKGLTLTVALHDAGGGDDIQVPVNFICNAVTGTTGTIELRATYPNADMALVPGQLVDVTVALSEIPDATLVPREAVNTGPDGQLSMPSRTARPSRCRSRCCSMTASTTRSPATLQEGRPGDRRRPAARHSRRQGQHHRRQDASGATARAR